MSATLNYNLKKAPAALFDCGRWDVLTQLIIHSDESNDCWPTVRRIAKRTGKSLETVTKAKQWLIDAGAIQMIPYDKREGAQKKLPKRQCVYHLTGIMNIEDQAIEYLYINRDDNGDIEMESEKDVTPTEISPSRISSQRNQSISNKNSSGSDLESKSLPEVANATPAHVDPLDALKEELEPLADAASDTTAGQHSVVTSKDLPAAPAELPLPVRYSWWFSGDMDNKQRHILKDDKGRPLCKVQPWKHPNRWQTTAHAPCPACLEALALATKPKEIETVISAPSEGVLDAICDLSYGTQTAWKANASKIRKCYNAIAVIGEPITKASVATFSDWWYANDWRGKKGQRPTTFQIAEFWATAMKGDSDESGQTASGTASTTSGSAPAQDGTQTNSVSGPGGKRSELGFNPSSPSPFKRIKPQL